MRNTTRAAAAAVLTVASFGAISGGGAPAGATVFANSSPITVPFLGPTVPAPWPGNPYPSSIAVSGLSGLITDVNLTLHSFDCSGNGQAYPEDIDLLLVGPAGSDAVVLSDVGGMNGADPNGFADLTVTLDDQAANPLPADTPLAPGSYRPIDDDDDPDETVAVDSFPAPAPLPSGQTALSTFNGTNPNGTWSLYLVDDYGGSDNCAVEDGWSIDILTSAAPPTSRAVSIADAPPVTEGDAGTTTLTYTVTLDADPSGPVTVDYTTVDGTATAGSDYVASAGTLAFGPGNASEDVTVTVNGDTTFEGSETVLVVLSNPSSGATIDDAAGIGTITDDDDPPAVTVTGGSGAESGGATFTLTLDHASGATVRVDHATATGTAGAADFTATSGTTTFAPGDTVETVTVPVTDDLVDENNESFSLVLSNPSGATLGNTSATWRIVDDDGPPRIGVNDVVVTEGNSGSKAMTFTVRLNRRSTKTVSVKFATANGSAVAPGDYTSRAGTVTFSPGQLARSVVVYVKGDIREEPNETLFLLLSSPVNATVADASGTGGILDND